MKTIKSKLEFEEVFKLGKARSSRSCKVKVLEVSPQMDSKVAYVASKRLGSAVFRNRSKRMLREGLRLVQLPQTGLKIILFATRSTYQTKPEQIALDIQKQLAEFGVSYA